MKEIERGREEEGEGDSYRRTGGRERQRVGGRAEIQVHSRLAMR